MQPTTQQINEFIARWKNAASSERAHAQAFIIELCGILDVPPPAPRPAGVTRESNTTSYGFERVARIPGDPKAKFIDLYRADCFVWENKQSKTRGTNRWQQEMEAAFAQGRNYALGFSAPRVPFLITCDIGHTIEVWSDFSRQGNFGGYAARETIPFESLTDEAVRTRLRLIFIDPMSLDPALHAARVTWEVAEYLAKLAAELEQAGHAPEAVARFLMRCLFTMFAEDVQLLRGDEFTRSLRESWVKHPEKFERQVVQLWTAMDQGGTYGYSDLLRFNGGLFRNPSALPLTGPQLERLLSAAERDWSAVEPSIFGTLLERALDERKRAELGAHFTPRAYIERLVVPTVIEPLRGDLDGVLYQVRKLLLAEVPTAKNKKAAEQLLRDFHRKLCSVRVLDPACGSGNFLYVTYDLLKRLESEVLRELYDLSSQVELITILPSQFLGLERNVRAREVADLVLWIGHLQWLYRRRETHAREPVLEEYKNIVAQDAVLAWEREELVRDDQGRVMKVWDMYTTRPDPVTGETVPDIEHGMVPMFKYTGVRAPAWPEADFIVGNPPFLGNTKKRRYLGDGYVEALQKAWPHVPSACDLVMYWWDRAATLVRAGKVRRFGLITTNSITQIFNRSVMEPHLNAESNGLRLVFAVADHPWVESGANVRIAMTVGAQDDESPQACVVGRVVAEGDIEGSEQGAAKDVQLACLTVSKIHSDLTVGANLVGSTPLRSNRGLTSNGMLLAGAGFALTEDEVRSLGYDPERPPSVVRPYMNARELMNGGATRSVIDLYGLEIEQVRDNYPAIYQRLVERVKPERDQNKERSRRERWWILGRPRTELRKGLRGLKRYIITPETSKHRVFTFAPLELCPDHMLYAVFLDAAWHLGVLSSRPQTLWSSVAGATLEDRPRWRNGTCFDLFPFPDATPVQQARIGALAERLDQHRRDAQARDPKTHLTAQYNALARLRAAKAGGAALTEAERAFHQRALTGVLAALHDDLDAAVAEAYGWPVDLHDEELLVRLVALNGERAAEEAAGTVRYLRASLQAGAGEQLGLVEDVVAPEDNDAPDAVSTATPWPKDTSSQFVTLRDLLVSRAGLWPLADIQRHIKGARAEELRESLHVLANLGVVIAIGEPPQGWRAR